MVSFRLHEITIDCLDVPLVAQFWAGLLGGGQGARRRDQGPAPAARRRRGRRLRTWERSGSHPDVTVTPSRLISDEEFLPTLHAFDHAAFRLELQHSYAEPEEDDLFAAYLQGDPPDATTVPE